MVRIIPNSGDSIETALVIVDAADHLDGIRAEYQYLEERYGKQGEDWDLVMQALLEYPPEEEDSGGPKKYYDMMIIEFPKGRVVNLYFDISSFFTKY
jgi:hypothetical protein